MPRRSRRLDASVYLTAGCADGLAHRPGARKKSHRQFVLDGQVSKSRGPKRQARPRPGAPSPVEKVQVLKPALDGVNEFLGAVVPQQPEATMTETDLATFAVDVAELFCYAVESAGSPSRLHRTGSRSQS